MYIFAKGQIFPTYKTFLLSDRVLPRCFNYCCRKVFFSPFLYLSFNQMVSICRHYPGCLVRTPSPSDQSHHHWLSLVLPYLRLLYLLRRHLTHFTLLFYKRVHRLLSCFPIPELARHKSNQGFSGSPGETFCLLIYLFYLLPSQEWLFLPDPSLFSLKLVFL